MDVLTSGHPFFLLKYKKNCYLRTWNKIQNQKNVKKIKHPLYPGYIYDRDGIAYFEVSYKGKRYRESSKLAFNQANRVKLLDLLEIKVMDIISRHEGANIYSLNELFNKYIDYKSKTITEETIYRYQLIRNEFLNINLLVTEINKYTDHLVNQINNSKLSNNTLVKKLELLRAFFSWCVDEGYIQNNPVRKSLYPKTTQKEVDPFTEAEIKKLLNYYKTKNNKMFLLITLIINSGLRISEAINLSKKNIKSNALWISPDIAKGGRQRNIPLKPYPNLIKVLDELAALNNSPTLFNVAKRFPHKSLLRVCTKLKIKNKGFHGFRKYFENKLIDENKPLKAVAEILGHTLPVQYKHYVKRSNVEDLEKLLM